MNVLIAISMLLTCAFPASGALDCEHPLKDPPPESIARVPSDLHYFSPNEEWPQDALPLWQRQAIEGIYFTVGTERGFIGAAASRKTTRLILVDRDPLVVSFNRINIALLQLSRPGDRLDYIHLRLHGSHREWLERLKNGTLPAEAMKLLTNPETWIWWQSQVRDNKAFSRFHATALMTPSQARRSRYYRGTSYLREDELFQRIQTLAQNGRIEAHFVDLPDEQRMQILVDVILKKQERLSIVDFSNMLAFNSMTRYPGRDGTTMILDSLVPALEEKTVLLFTSKEMSLRSNSWRYRGMYYSTLRMKLKNLEDAKQWLFSLVEDRDTKATIFYDPAEPLPPLPTLFEKIRRFF